MFEIQIASDAREDLGWFRKGQQALILEDIKTQLAHQPTKETRNRKRLRPDHLTQWELRIGETRVFYDVDVKASLVRVVAIGYKKREKLYFCGQEYTP